MNWLWPGFLLLLGLIPLLAAIYIWNLRRRRRFAVRFSSLLLVRQALPQVSRLRRHLPFVLFLLALACLITALARPAAVLRVPSDRATILLAIDVSRSMCSTDIAPNRLRAAQDAALSFIERQDANLQIGIVAFAGFAELVQPPTTDREALRATIERLSTGRRTGIGNAILRSLDAIAEVDKGIAPSSEAMDLGTQVTPVEPGKFAPQIYAPQIFAPHIIVLLTDGANNVGIPPILAAQQAVERGIRVYTIGFGTPGGGSMSNCGQQYQEFDSYGGGFGGGGFGGGGFGGGGFRRGIDEPTLREVAAMTSGEYYAAASVSELQNVFRSLPTNLMTRRELMEISVIFAALGATLAALAVILSLLWNAVL